MSLSGSEPPSAADAAPARMSAREIASTAPSNIPAFLFASLMTLMAGFVDAIGYSRLAGLYLSFMSGNSTSMGVALAEGKFGFAVRAAGIISLFVTGAVLGTAIGDRAGRFSAPIIFIAEAAIFAIALTGIRAGVAPFILVVLAIAMGMQNVLHRELWGADVGKSFVTGTLVSLGQSIARLRRPGMAQASLALMVSWCLFVTGATLGAVAASRLGLAVTLLLGLSVLAGMSVASLVFSYRGQDV